MKAISTSAYPALFAHGLMFHRFHVSGRLAQGQGSLTEKQFEDILLHVGVDRILSPQQWLSKLNSKTLRDSDLCLTFDDGLKSQIDVALPVLDHYELKAFFFVFSSVFEGGVDRNEVYNQFASAEFLSFEKFTDAFFEFYPVPQKEFLENGYEAFAANLRRMFPFYSEQDIKFRFVRNKLLSRARFEQILDGMIQAMGIEIADIARHLWMNDQDLQRLVKAGHTIGLHSYSHPFELKSLGLENQKEEYRRNHEHLSRITGQKIEAMSHPLNSYGNETLNILSNMGIQCGFRSNTAAPADSKMNGGNLEIAREDATNILR